MGEKHLDVVAEGTRTIRGVIRQLKWGTVRGGYRPYLSIELEPGGSGWWFTVFDERLMRSFCVHVIGRELGLIVKSITSGKGGGTYFKVVDVFDLPELWTREEILREQEEAATLDDLIDRDWDVAT